jgi:hypothetical protein
MAEEEEEEEEKGEKVNKKCCFQISTVLTYTGNKERKSPRNLSTRAQFRGLTNSNITYLKDMCRRKCFSRSKKETMQCKVILQTVRRGQIVAYVFKKDC